MPIGIDIAQLAKINMSVWYEFLDEDKVRLLSTQIRHHPRVYDRAPPAIERHYFVVRASHDLTWTVRQRRDEILRLKECEQRYGRRYQTCRRPSKDKREHRKQHRSQNKMPMKIADEIENRMTDPARRKDGHNPKTQH